MERKSGKSTKANNVSSVNADKWGGAFAKKQAEIQKRLDNTAVDRFGCMKWDREFIMK